MSADNWRICPACLKKAQAEQEKKAKRARDAYGVESPDEYDRLCADARQEIKLEPTLAEYYEVGVGEDGEFLVSYSGGCRACTFSHEFRHKEQLKVPEPGRKR